MSDAPALECVVEDERWTDAALSAPLDAVAERAFGAALAVCGLTPEHRPAASALFADDAALAALNARFRDRAGPTNVLSFPSAERAAAPLVDRRINEFLGDLAISFDTVADEARNRSLRLEDHLAHLIVHGTLHLIGHDHVQDAAAERMERLEVEALAALGIADPYRIGAAVDEADATTE